MRPAPCVAVFALAVTAASVMAGEEPAPRPLAQASAKQALGETKLDDAQMTAVYADLEKFAGRWARHVKAVGPAAARKEDMRQAVDDGVRDALYQRGLALSAQEAIIDALVLRAEAILRDYERLVAGQGKVKRAIEDSGTEEPLLSEVFADVLELADKGYGWVKTPGAGEADRIPASELIARELAPTFARSEMPEKHVKRISEAAAQWLEARAAFEVELDRDK